MNSNGNTLSHLRAQRDAAWLAPADRPVPSQAVWLAPLYGRDTHGPDDTEEVRPEQCAYSHWGTRHWTLIQYQVRMQTVTAGVLRCTVRREALATGQTFSVETLLPLLGQCAFDDWWRHVLPSLMDHYDAWTRYWLDVLEHGDDPLDRAPHGTGEALEQHALTQAKHCIRAMQVLRRNIEKGIV
jgi:hypothetical protein